MHLAASGHLDILQYLHGQHMSNISATDRYGNTPLHDAIANNQLNVALKANGARAATNTGYVKDRDILQAAADGNLEEVKWLNYTAARKLATMIKAKAETFLTIISPIYRITIVGRLCMWRPAKATEKLFVNFSCWRRSPYA